MGRWKPAVSRASVPHVEYECNRGLPLKVAAAHQLRADISMVGVFAVYPVESGAYLGDFPPHGGQSVGILGYSASAREQDVQV